MSLETHIKQKALDLGFDAVGITNAEPVEAAHAEHFQRWLDDGCAAQMAYMHRNVDKRFDPAKLLDGAKSVICVALNYRPAENELAEDPPVRIARFAQYEDYHPFIKDRLFQLAEFIKTQRREPCEYDTIKFKACVDSVPIAERALAQRAGLGFIGRNHMLIHPELGNQILLGELITTLELVPDEPMEDLDCGDCGKCIRACPTGALGADGSFDSRKCTCECEQLSPCQGPVPRSGEGAEGPRELNYIFGCDECILACPHELSKPQRQNKDFQHHPEWQNLTPDQIQSMTEDDFQKIFAGSGFIRLGLDRLKRNAACIRQVPVLFASVWID
ncbi:MAG: tRNA epoxyqueuosine(34) reductase QueG [Planctomycetota bacterium]|jgi:epoxyqueuosine reductase